MAAQEPAKPGLTGDHAAKMREGLLKLHLDDAASYASYRDPEHQEKAELVREPVYVWTRIRSGPSQQDGAVFIWTYRGRPEAIGSDLLGARRPRSAA